MRKLTSVLATCAALAVSLSSAHAAQLYVPLTNYPGDGTTLEIVVTNPDTTARTFTGAILAEGTNGNTDHGTPTGAVTVDPRTTRVIKAPPGNGTWRLSGFDGLEISARMRVPTAAADYQGEEVPLLDSDNVHPANSTAIVQSLLAAHGYLTDFALWNAAKVNARCEASVHLANGTQIGPDFRDPRRAALAHVVRERRGGGGDPRPGLAGPHQHDLRSGLLRLLAHGQSADRLSRDPHRGEQHRGRSAECRLHADPAAAAAGSAAAEQRPAPAPSAAGRWRQAGHAGRGVPPQRDVLHGDQR